ncbi:MAG: hypothetical protein ACYCO4_03470 [Sulfobacillus sp.]
MCRRNRIDRLSVLLLGLLVAASACGSAAVGPLPVVAGGYPVHRLLSTLCPPPAVHTVTGFAGGGQILGYQPGWGILVAVGNEVLAPSPANIYPMGLYLVNAQTSAVRQLVALAVPSGSSIRATIGDGEVAWVTPPQAGHAMWALQTLNLATGRRQTVATGRWYQSLLGTLPGPVELTIVSGQLYFLQHTAAASTVLAFNFTTGRLRTVLTVPAHTGQEIVAMVVGPNGVTYSMGPDTSGVGAGTAGEIDSFSFTTAHSRPLLIEHQAAVGLALAGSTLVLVLPPTRHPPVAVNPAIESAPSILSVSPVLLYPAGAMALTQVAAITPQPQVETWSHFLTFTWVAAGGGVLDLATNQIYLLPNIGFFFNLGVYNGILGWTGALFKPAPTGSTAAVTVVQDIAWCSLAD